MAQRITKHSTRLSQVHEGAAPATDFSQGQRVMTIDGLPGRILFVASSFSPGVTEYEVTLDGGLGQGTYTASQLRSLPADYRAGASPVPRNLLPAGVTARYITEDEARQAWRESPEARTGMSAEEALRGAYAAQEAAFAHLASEDYPEMGSILTDRPDPGALISVIGIRKTAADSYGRPDDARDDEYNGGPGDTGMYWAEPGEQQWTEENLGPQEEAPPPPWAVPPVLARLAQIEEASRMFGGTLYCATTINGTPIDNHGDAPEHGTIPRAGNPDSYDDRSTEGDGDPKWDDPVDPKATKEYNGATVGMYPEGMSAGGGPGLEIGGFIAARVPWTGHERTELHNWADVPTGTEGDFVPSTDFTGRHEINVPAEELAQQELRAEASSGACQQALAQLEEDYPPEALEWLRHASVTGPHYVPLRSIDWSDRHTWTSYKQPNRVDGFLDTMEKKAAKGKPLKAALVVVTPGRTFIGDGHHRSLAQLLASAAGRGPAAVWAFTARVGKTSGPWDTMHDRQIRAPSKDDGSTKDVTGPDAPPDQVAGFQDEVDQAVGGLTQDAHDDPDNSLDNSGPDNANAQASGLSGPDNNPDNWPAAGAQVNETGPAKTQGRNDGKRKRALPGKAGARGQLRKDAALAMFVAAAESPSYRFHFTAAWHDVVAKAKRIRSEGHVRITHATLGMVIGEVRGDHDIYESGIQRPPGKPQTIQHWACGCPWASFHQDKSFGARYSGRPCSHVMALQFEAQARGMFGKSVAPDEHAPEWSPSQVTVKSWPPYEGDPHKGHWTDYWRAPSAEAPAQRATAALLAAGEETADLLALARLGGFTASLRPFLADQANSSWGSDNVTKQPPVKPYGATEPPDKDQDPGSYGFLSAPDPENWGSIQDDSYLQSPLSNQAHKVLAPGAPGPLPADLNYPDIGDFRQDQESFGYTDRSNTAGPSTSIDPGDPQGIRMEEARRQTALPEWIRHNREAEGKCTRCGGEGQTINAGTGDLMCWDCHTRQVEKNEPRTAELHEEPEAALPSTTGEEGIETAAIRDRPGAYESVRERFRMMSGGSMGDLARETFPQAQQPSAVTQEPGMGSMDEPLSPEDPSIQTVGSQQWSGGGADSDEVAAEPGDSQGSIDDIVASFQRSAAAGQYTGGGQVSGSDIAAAAREFLSKTADVLPDAEAAELISEGRGQRARNLDLLRIEGTHYEEEDGDLARRGLSLDDYDDDVISV